MIWWWWVLGGLMLLGLELLTPGGFVLVFFGIAGVLTGLLTAAGVAGPPWAQWLLFSVISVASLLFFRRPLLNWMRSREGVRPPVDSLVGEIATLQEDLPAGGTAKVELRGTAWTARSRAGAALPSGARCRVEAVDQLTLWIRAE